jgi:uncharacterized protein (TIGR03437 family)
MLFSFLAAVLIAQTIAPNGVTNAASYAAGFVSAGEIIAIFGQGLGPQKLATFQLDKAGRIGTSLAGVAVTVDGRPAPLLYVSAGQIGAIVPYGISSPNPRLSVTVNGVTSPSAPLTLADAQPGIFSLDSSGTGQAAAINQDGSLNGVFNPASKGAVISLYGTGEGHTNPGGTDGQINLNATPRPVLSVSATVSGVPATVLYAAAAPGQVAGMIQVNIRVPSEVSSGLAVPVVIQIGAKSSPKGVTIAVQ